MNSGTMLSALEAAMTTVGVANKDKIRRIVLGLFNGEPVTVTTPNSLIYLAAVLAFMVQELKNESIPADVVNAVRMQHNYN